jgi:phosphoribosyl 1,2-cyclic phosphodiesterase
MKLTFLGTRGEIDIRTPLHRMHSSLMITDGRGRVMIDCGLDWLDAVWDLAPRPHGIVLTHAHPDHAWGLHSGSPCPVYATRRTWQGLTGFEIADRHVVRQRQPFTIKGITLEAFAVEHSIRAPAVGYRVTAGRACIFYVPDVVWIRDRNAALSGARVYIGDGASISQPLIRRRGRRLIGHAPVSAQLAWCHKAGIGHAIITHCGSRIVSAHSRAAATLHALGNERGVAAQIARDGMTVRV